jgi:hypothetical protein
MNLTEHELHEIAAVMWNLGKDELEKAGAIDVGATGGTCWDRFNADPLAFILKAPTTKRGALVDLINSKARAELE